MFPQLCFDGHGDFPNAIAGPGGSSLPSERLAVGVDCWNSLFWGGGGCVNFPARLYQSQSSYPTIRPLRFCRGNGHSELTPRE